MFLLRSCCLSAVLVSAMALAGEGPSDSTPRALSPEAQSVLEYFRSIEGKRILAGQQSDYFRLKEDRNLAKILKHTGKVPAIRGYEIRADVPDPVESMIQWWKEGGIVTASAHWGAPPLPDSYKNCKKKTDLSRVLTPGTREHRSFLEKLDAAGAKFRRLQNAGVPVLFRPFHEMDGTWFWWSQGGLSRSSSCGCLRERT